MNEDFLHFVWKYKLMDVLNLYTTDGELITIINAGTHNKHAGPDFFNARIKIGQTVWAGNVEIHKNASDWYKHKHFNDKTYDNVILHVVLNADQLIINTLGIAIPTLSLGNRLHEKVLQNYHALLKASQGLPCQSFLSTVNSLAITNWLERLLVERLEDKIQLIEYELKNTVNNWEETFYRMIARGFGFNINAEPFLLLARSLPSLILAKHKNSLFQLESLLFGQSGLLIEDFNDEYPQKLRKEYEFLAIKHRLQPVDAHLWKYLRLRPSNFPTLRIAQFADLVFKSNHLLNRILEKAEVKQLIPLFDIKASSYWNTHFSFDKATDREDEKILGRESIYNILINVVIPFIFFYGKQHHNEDVSRQALSLLETIPSENNVITKLFSTFGVKCENAAQSQALVQLKNNYCDKKYCLNCSIGVNILKKCYNE
ncbi:DUF2851 family protein [Solitalea canadensis]|uniref:DUF2851 domain-containing protein n=1 Tax=Solitalea canadensis (strain ATCC 29591 / DSM 3403 / JCM 21819 / LMG 8368 / NBRC 15130 / NCIMB 12057 / USAM 9D) TaxID=929556 RepID=H8KUC8_SOLCM|nr:DUF2851 family protein [Solitalea canadensis]AFD07293.1 Protein of unknown function (DUF2851) [Solitalea canadensis DSM 3403]